MPKEKTCCGENADAPGKKSSKKDERSPSKKEHAPRNVTPKNARSKPKGISSEAIALRAYYLAERRQQMGSEGNATSDWIEAEMQLIAEAKKQK